MPYVDEGGPPPSTKGKPHLGLLIKDGTMTALPVGTVMALIMDPSRLDGITPMVLVKVSQKELVFRCACGNGSCTRVMTYRMSQSGRHPYLVK